MFIGDRINDEYELHQRRFAHLTEDGLDHAAANFRVVRPLWYNSILAQIGDGLIAAGRSIKAQNVSAKPNDFSVSKRQYETFPE